MPRKFYTLDVFTKKPLSGNQLAVVLDSDGLDDAKMQAIAAEFNLSETVFVSPPKELQNGAAIRIFVPTQELPFAGHPTVGTAILLNHLAYLGVGNQFVLEEKVGPVPCTISGESDEKTARFAMPKLAAPIDHGFEAQPWAKATGLESDEMDLATAGLWDAGLPYTLIPVQSMDAMRKIKIDNAALKSVEPYFNGVGANPYVFCEGGEAPDTDFHTRMFAPFQGIAEDPATGSAAATLSGWIARYKMSDTERRSFKIEQGYEMGRPSQIYLDIEKRDGKVVEAGISGSAVIMSEGVLHV